MEESESSAEEPTHLLQSLEIGAFVEPRPAMEFALRVCGPGDETELSLIGQATILETYAGIAEGADLYDYVSSALSVDKFAALLSSDRVRAWTVETAVGSSVVGYALAIVAEDRAAFSQTELERLYILYRFHGLGLGKRLMDAVLEHARANKTSVLRLRVNSQNQNAIDFYERYGFVTVSEEPFRAGDRDYRTLVMERTL
jgi:diamine N-acetyltransferase